ncbi:cysteine hydrolase family protein [uncultured Veillonella sp.]|uniref:cysteine hydrolase family protein n=1 Tax=uncultured Veillonella sp. TaxID=159268 RepID=UPI0025EFF62C|nr:isochorismatase family cysteine hydrolase [uncultured Veillonella sp.]MDY3973916.1 isochorismatase family cysteine hydrolase [Veillonella caviae]
MAHQVLVVVDMQNDFITGSLGSPTAEAIVSQVADKIRNFEGLIFYTLDTHDEGYLESQEGKNLPVSHCVEGTPGWELASQIVEAKPIQAEYVYCKGQFGSVELAEDLRDLHDMEGIDSIELVGLCTDICVVSNAMLLKAFLPEVPVIVDASCCAGVSTETHEAALTTMKTCQIIVK